jgi:hypothetical protein
MTDREILVEILAIQQYEHDLGADIKVNPWRSLCDEDRQIYRNIVAGAAEPEDMYTYGDDA